MVSVFLFNPTFILPLSFIAPFIPLFNTALILSIMFTALAAIICYVGQEIMGGDIKAYLKDQMFHLIISMILAVFLSSWIVLFEGIFSNMAGISQYGSQFIFASTYITNSLNNLTRLYLQLFLLEFGIGIASSFSLSLPFGYLGFVNTNISFSTMQGLGIFNSINSKILYFLGTAFGAFVTQRYLLYFARNTMLSVFFPLGIFLRILPFTREAGSNIIAIAFAFYFIFPMSYLFFEKASYNLTEFTQSRIEPTFCSEMDEERTIDDVEELIASYSEKREEQQEYFPRINSIIRGVQTIIRFTGLAERIISQLLSFILAAVIFSIPTSFLTSYVPILFIFEIQLLTKSIGMLTLSIFTLFFSVNLTYVSYRIISSMLGASPELYGFSKFL